MGVLNIFFFIFLFVSTAKSDGETYRFLHTFCVQLNALPSGQTFDTLIAAMEDCIEYGTCVGVKKTGEDKYQQLLRLTGYAFCETCTDYYLLDKTGGLTYPNQPNDLEAVILFAIFPIGECPTSFDVDGSLCRGRGSITADICYSYPSYMAPQHDGTNCYVYQKQTVIKSWQ
uniref:Uncharacterized protein n=1 Tax=Panagrolaimus davidi TaxID=227884 RepID=A0A914P1U8_9BILA